MDIAFIQSGSDQADVMQRSAISTADIAGFIDPVLQSSSQSPASLPMQIMLAMSVLAIIPSIILMMTSFTRIIIVLSILRQALGLQQTPPNHVLIGLSLILSAFVMEPVYTAIVHDAIIPYREGQIGMQAALEQSSLHIRTFMQAQTRQSDILLFTDIAKATPVASADDVSFSILLPAFVTSELKTAFIIGFLIYIPFLIIDLVVSTTLMALGMMMLSPSMISLPFKLLLFVMVDGWSLTMGSLASSFGAA